MLRPQVPTSAKRSYKTAATIAKACKLLLSVTVTGRFRGESFWSWFRREVFLYSSLYETWMVKHSSLFHWIICVSYTWFIPAQPQDVLTSLFGTTPVIVFTSHLTLLPCTGLPLAHPLKRRRLLDVNQCFLWPFYPFQVSWGILSRDLCYSLLVVSLWGSYSVTHVFRLTKSASVRRKLTFVRRNEFCLWNNVCVTLGVSHVSSLIEISVAPERFTKWVYRAFTRDWEPDLMGRGGGGAPPDTFCRPFHICLHVIWAPLENELPLGFLYLVPKLTRP